MGMVDHRDRTGIACDARHTAATLEDKSSTKGLARDYPGSAVPSGVHVINRHWLQPD
jgi:hypothetical protein